MTTMIKAWGKDAFRGVVLIAVVVIAIFTLANIGSLLNNAARYQATNVLAWGNNGSGQLGNGQLTPDVLIDKTYKAKLEKATELVGGLQHSIALMEDGSVLAWGNNDYGQVGNGKIGGNQVLPAKVDGLPKITMLATKQDHNLALDEKGHVWAWGLNMSGQLGDGTNENKSKPQIVSGISDVASIAVGYRSSIAIKHDGSVWVWGGYCNLENRNKDIQDYVALLSISGYNDNAGGTLEEVTPEDDCTQEKYLNILSYTPKKIQGVPPVKSLSAGFGHVLAITNDGELWSWGCGRYGQVGNGITGSTDLNLTPHKVLGIGHVRTVSAGFRHSMAITDDGKVWSWGHNYFSELGDGTENDTNIPHELKSLKDIKNVYAGHDYSLALGNDGRLWGWGQASFGQLGVSEVRVAKPIALLKLNNVTAATTGGGHVLTLTGDKEK